MDAQMNLIHSETHVGELAAEAIRWQGPIRRLGAEAAVTVRAAVPDDRPQLLALAELDTSPLPAAPILIAEVASRPLAALSLASNCVIADPFMPSREAVELLRFRARQLRGGRIAGWRRRVLR